MQARACAIGGALLTLHGDPPVCCGASMQLGHQAATGTGAPEFLASVSTVVKLSSYQYWLDNFQTLDRRRPGQMSSPHTSFNFTFS